jgi:hypothetical protein
VLNLHCAEEAGVDKMIRNRLNPSFSSRRRLFQVPAEHREAGQSAQYSNTTPLKEAIAPEEVWGQERTKGLAHERQEVSLPFKAERLTVR